MVTPVNIKRLQQLLFNSKYDKEESKFIIESLCNGFEISYAGPRRRRDFAKNLPFRDGVGSKGELWEKMMKEVKLKRFAGPYRKEEISYDFFAQSPIGLVPKGDDSKQTRLIFHLSYDHPNGNKSINAHTPKDKCSVKYKDLDFAVRVCLRHLFDKKNLTTLWFSKSDLKSAFHLLGLKLEDWPLLMMMVMMAVHPDTGESYYFFNKCLPFGASISCSHFQRFSNGHRHVFEYITDTAGQVPNYLDDFLFIATCMLRCKQLVLIFLCLCQELNITVSLDKTEWATLLITFLGVVLDGAWKLLCVPKGKRIKATNLL